MREDTGDCRSGTVATREPSRVSPSRPVGRVSTIAARGLCRFGHPNTPENTQRIGKAGVRCKECRRRIARESARRARIGDSRQRVLENARRSNATYRARKNNADELLSFARRFGMALRRLKTSGAWSDGPAPWTISNQLVAARRRGLCESKNVSKHNFPVNRWRITPLGLSVLTFADELRAASVGRNAERQDAEERLGPQDEHAVPNEDSGDAQ